MTQRAEFSETIYPADGATLSFATSWTFTDPADVQVLVGAPGGETLRTRGIDYSLVGADTGLNGANVVFAVAPVLGAGQHIVIRRETPMDQPSRFGDLARFVPLLSERAYDRIVRMIQDLRTRLNRALLAPYGETLGVLPPKASRVGQFLGFDAAGNIVTKAGTVSVTLSAQGIAEVNLVDFLNLRHGVGGWTHGTVAPVTGVLSGTDCGPALNDALDALRISFGRGTVRVPPGNFRIATPPTPSKLNGNYIKGAGGTFATLLLFDNGSETLFNFTGAGGYTGGGLEDFVCLLGGGYGDCLAKFLIMQGDATYQPDNMTLKNLYVSILTGSRWHSLWQVIGTARDAGVPPYLQGCRVLQAENLQLFGAHTAGVALYNLVQASIDNLGIYVSTGSGQDLFVSGGGPAGQNTTQVSLTRLVISRNINLGNCTNIKVEGVAAQVVANPSCDYYDIFVHAPSGLAGSLGAHGRSVVMT